MHNAARKARRPGRRWNMRFLVPGLPISTFALQAQQARYLSQRCPFDHLSTHY